VWQNQVTGGIVYWLLGGTTYYGSYGYIAPAVSPEWKVVGLADLNGDGSLDLVWQNQVLGDVLYWLMRGTTYTNISNYIIRDVPNEWRISAVADLNGDSSADLIWRNKNNGDVLYWQMNGVKWGGVEGYLTKGVSLNWRIVGPR
jgi:hypothetical protein